MNNANAYTHISKALQYFGDAVGTDLNGTNTSKAQAQATIAMAISLDRIADALEALARPTAPEGQSNHDHGHPAAVATSKPKRATSTNVLSSRVEEK